MSEERLVKVIIDAAFVIHNTIGPGMLENVYKTCLAYKLRQDGLSVEVEKPILVIFEQVKMDCGYRADLVIEQKIVIDIKSMDAIADIHIAQVLTYLRFLQLRYGLILNFRTVLMKDGIRRVLNGFERL